MEEVIGSIPTWSTKSDGGRTTVVEVFLYNGTFGLKLDASYLFRHQTKKADQWWSVFFCILRKIFLKFCYFRGVYSEDAFLKMNEFSVPNHNFREVLSEGGCCRRRKFDIENSKTSFVLKGLYQGKKSHLDTGLHMVADWTDFGGIIFMPWKR